MATITLPDGSAKHVPEGATVRGVAEMIGKRLAAAAIVGRLDGKLVDLSNKKSKAITPLAIVTDRDPDGLFCRPSTARRTSWPRRCGISTATRCSTPSGRWWMIAFITISSFRRGCSVEELPKVEAEMPEDHRTRIISFARDECPPTRPRNFYAARGSVQGRDHRRACRRRRKNRFDVSAGGFSGPVPRAACAEHGEDQSVQIAHRGRGRIGAATPPSSNSRASTARPSSTRRIWKII